MVRYALIVSIFAPTIPGLLRADVIWWEAEATVATNFREHPWLEMTGEARDGLSGGDWLTLMHKPKQTAPKGGRYFARYRVRVPVTSRYHLWSREWPRRRALPNRWRFDDQQWRDAGKEIPFENRVLLAKDRVAAWSRYGVVNLNAGEHTFDVEVSPLPGNVAFDCFLLYRGRFQPSGKQKPKADANAFYEYPENQRVEVIVRKKREEAEEIRRLKDEVDRSKVNQVDFTKVGREIDVVRFGELYKDELRGHGGGGRFGKDPLPPRHIVFGRNGFVEWQLTAPSAGEYILTIAVNIARLPNRTAKLSIELDDQWRDYGLLAKAGQYHCLVKLPKGGTRFRLSSVGGGPVYFGGARLSTMRGDPWRRFTPGEHPLLQFNSEEIAKIQRRVSADPKHPVRYYYDGLLSAAEKQVASPSPLRSSRSSAQALNEVAVAYALTGKKECGDRGADYLERLSQRDFGRNPTSVLGNGEYLDAVAWGYDILYPHLSEAQRKAVRERLDLEAHWMWVQMLTLSKDTIHGWWASDHSNNWQAVAAGGLGMAALALLGESSDAELWLEEAISQVKMLMDGGFDSGGAYFESPMYHKYAMEYLTNFASALYRSGRENLFDYRDQLLRKTCLYNLYMMEPTRDHFAPFNDGRRLAGRPPEALHPAGAYFARLSSIYRDGLIRWLFDAMYGPGRRFPVWNFMHGHPDCVVWYDDTVPVEDPDTSPRLALARYWPEHGRVALRTGWNDPNGILFAMECGEYGSHGHADQGSFVLTAYGEHLVDDTGYGGWEAESEAHSVVLIDGVGQRKNGMLGVIRDFIHTQAMDYFQADSTAAYTTDKSPTQFVKRYVLFMRPSYFIIVDHVKKNDDPHAYQWLLHSQVLPPTTEIKIAKPSSITFLAKKASLHIRLALPKNPRSEVVRKHGHSFLRVATPSEVGEATFFAMLYPVRVGQAMPVVTPIRSDAVIGCRIANDIALWSRTAGVWRHADIKTDARFAACRRDPPSVFAKSARMLEGSTFGFKADKPITAILSESEARLVLSKSSSITFGNRYMSGAAVYETDQDRDLKNDRRVGTVKLNGEIELPAGSFTVRR